MTPEDRLITRAVIQFCVNLGKTPSQTLKLMNEASSETQVKRMLVYKWHKRFSEGRESICDDVRSGRPVSQTTECDVEAVKNIVDADRRVTLYEICKMLDMSYGSVWGIMKDSLKMSRVSARWVPRLLTEDEMSKRVRESRRFLARYKKEGNRFLEKIVTCDET
ncbi:protein GVQW3-like [Mya arenaria]|uniref:protein GVQW3-like n=1 Tax=Mya arenaria TaxID=6604 RepID=UPI0022E0F857|nr:protein GVQW3-like [Mya arenaria]